MSILISNLRAAAEQQRAAAMPRFASLSDQAATELEQLNKVLALKLDALPSGLTTAQANRLERPIGEHIKSAIRVGGQLMVKQTMRGK